MPTEITTQVSKAHAADTSRVQQDKVIAAADRIDARQSLSVKGHSVPSARESSQPSKQQLEQAANNLNVHAQSLKRDLHFSVDEDTGETIIRVIDSASQKMIRTIPSDEFISMSQQLSQSVGMLLNAKA